MQLDQLPPEVLTQIFTYLEGQDLESLSQVSSWLRAVSLFDPLWKTSVNEVRDRIQLRPISEGFRSEHFTQKTVNQRVRAALHILADKSVDDKERSNQLDLIWALAERARPVLLEEAKLISNPSISVMARTVLQLIKHKRAIDQLKSIGDSSKVSDLMVAVEAFHPKYTLNPTKDAVFGHLVDDAQETMAFCSNPRMIQRTALALATNMFSVPSQSKPAYDVCTPDAGHLCNMASSATEDASDMVNIAKYAYVGAQYGLQISPVVLAKTGANSHKFVDSNYARVADPTKEEGYFIINPLSQAVMTGQDFQDMMDQQRFIRLVAGVTSPAPLSVIALSNCQPRIRPKADYESSLEHVSAMVANLAVAVLFCSRNDEAYDTFYRSVETATNPRLGKQLSVDRAQFEHEIDSGSVPTLYRQLILA
uniref:ARAD1B13684p n=1 Tax=Blastobotrys adeninivorans TaxID=409370 RepID=A0A060T6P5_BLAAD